MSSYNFELSEPSKLCHLWGATEHEHGVMVHLQKDISSGGLPAQFIKSNHTIDQMFAERPTFPKDVAFIQICPPATVFSTYQEEVNTFALTIAAYLKVLEVFRSDFHLVMKRMDSDVAKIKDQSDWVKLTATIQTSTVSNIVYKNSVDLANNFNLELIIIRNVETNRTQACLKYSEESMGSCILPTLTMANLCKDRPVLTNLLDYKDTASRKRSH